MVATYHSTNFRVDTVWTNRFKNVTFPFIHFVGTKVSGVTDDNRLYLLQSHLT